MASLAVDDQERVIAITLNGEIGPGDNKDFAQAAVITDSAMVFLDSPGGDLQAGVDIGKTIWLKKFSTIVPKGSICASACALAWLAGRPRYLAPGALVGFHAPGKANDAESFPDAAGSAMVDGYLSQIGLSASAIAYVNEMKPNEMRWLTTMDAKRLGIRTEIWDSHLEP